MTELKTLKDFEYLGQDGRNMLFRDIRAEAVKWVKHCEYYGYAGEMGWIINFFNLTEEDLK